MAKYIPSRNYIGSSEIATDLDVTGPVDIDGAVQINNTLTVGVDDTGYDVKFFGATSGRYMLWDESQNRLEFTDNTKAIFGDGGDLQLSHDGTSSYITNSTGNLFINNNNDDGDIIFKSDDGSGGTTAYITLDGGEGYTIANKKINFSDNVRATFGASNDMQIHHDGSNNYIETNNTGHLYIQQNHADHDVIFQSDDGSGGTTTYFKLDGSDTKLVASKNLKFDQSPSYIFFNGNNTFVGELSNSGKLQLRGGGSNTAATVYIDSSGNMGLGTSAPSSKLDVRGTVQVGVDDTGYDVVFYGATSGRYLQWDESADALKFTDSAFLYLGASNDLQFYHNGTNSVIANYGGDFYISQNTNDKDIIFECDDGSGGTTAYLTLDGSDSAIKVGKELQINGDNRKLKLGASGDLEIFHDGTDSKITNSTGDLYIINGADDKDIIFQCDDGGGGLTTYLHVDGNSTLSKFLKPVNFGVDDSGVDVTFYGDTSGRDMLWKQAQDALILKDSVELRIGTGYDLRLYHDGSNSRIRNNNGDLYISQNADDKDIIFTCDDGSGGTETYFFLDGSASAGSPFTVFPDSSILAIGTGFDLRLKHDGSNSYIQQVGIGDLYIQQGVNDKDIIFQCDDGSGGTTPYLTLDGGLGYTTVQKRIRFNDDVSLALGSDNDLQLSHDATNSYINNSTGNLEIVNNADDKDIIFKCDDGSGGVTTYFKLDGSLATHDGSSTTTMYTKWEDNSIISLGTSNDIRIYHNGTDSYLDNLTGDYYIRQKANDKDLILQCDDGSGGNTAYITLDGSVTKTIFSKPIEVGSDGAGHDVKFFLNASGRYIMVDEDDNSLIFTDNASAKFGNGGDLQLMHDGTDSRIDNMVGHLKIRNYSDNSDIIFETDNGSGSTTEYFRLDGGDADGTLTYTKWADNSIVTLGASKDLRIYHNGTNSIIQNYTGDLKIRNGADDGDIIFDCDDGSGGLETYFRLDGSGNTDGNPRTVFPDQSRLLFGDGYDMDIFHNGTNSFIRNNSTSGDLIIEQGGDDKDIIFKCDDGSGNTTAYITLDGSDTDIKVHKNFEIEKTLTMQHTADPSDPATGHSVMWSDTSGNLKVKINVGGSVVTRTLATGSD